MLLFPLNTYANTNGEPHNANNSLEEGNASMPDSLDIIAKQDFGKVFWFGVWLEK